ncbi:hypothetical protein GF402_01565, partial [Candidatus Fermentibacteria bacterium]|nr:hypothetical protein [Candidatus Fermentibacteria bacterium]
MSLSLVGLAGSMLILLIMPFSSCNQSRSSEEPGDGGEWVELDMGYEISPDSISTYRGTVRYVEEDPLPEYVMRFNPYKLEADREPLGPQAAAWAPPEPPIGPETQTIDIYMGSTDVLQPFIGKTIELRGKIVTLTVEGHAFLEIWP